MSFEAFALPAIILLVITSVIILMGNDWRLGISALGAQYVGVFGLVALSWPLEMAVIKLVAGWIAAAVLGMELVSGSSSQIEQTPPSWSGRLFKLILAGLIILVVFSVAPEAAKWILSASYEQILGGLLLMSMGILHLGLTTHPYRVVLGLLTFFSGFEILFGTIETSTFMAGFFAVFTLGIALLGSYLNAVLRLEVEA